MKLILAALCSGLTGCAAVPVDVTSCSNVISGFGGILKFCQTGNKINVSESGITKDDGSGSLKIVNDPEALQALTRDISMRPEFARSRKLVAHACLIKGEAYVNIKVSDLRRILHTSPVASASNL